MGNVERVAALADGRRTLQEIADAVGLSRSGVKKIVARCGLPVRHPGPPSGERNPAWVGGRMIDLDGYVLLKTSPRRVLEHRQIMEKVLGRPLGPKEVVDHIDGLTLHNCPSNLRVFSTNGEHLKATLTGRGKRTSRSGAKNIGARIDRDVKIQRVDIYRQRKERGDARLLAILRAALQLGIDSPYLSGSSHWLISAGIDPSSRPSLERGLAELGQRYELDLLR
jgi:hypothetical protein